MQRTQPTFPITNFILFLATSMALLLGYKQYLEWKQPRVAQHAEANKPEADKPDAKKPDAEKPDAKKPAADQKGAADHKAGDKQPKVAEKVPPADKPAPAGKQPSPPKAKPDQKPTAKQPAEPKKYPRQWVALGSASPDSPYRMLVTLSSRGAAVARIELSSQRYHELEDRSGYLGHLVLESAADSKVAGCPVQVVGPGTPAAEAEPVGGGEKGLKSGDVITALDGKPIQGPRTLEDALIRTKPKQKVRLTVERGGKSVDLLATLGWRPLEVVRPERKNPANVKAGQAPPDAIEPDDNSPLSMLTTLEQVGDVKMPESANAADEELDRELPGVHLRDTDWEKVEADQEHAVFRRTLSQGVEIIKTYRLVKVPEKSLRDADYPGYSLDLAVEIRNLGDKKREVAYRLDGPNGLPREGWWYAGKVGRRWFDNVGLRDVLVWFDNNPEPEMIGCVSIADGKAGLPWTGRSIPAVGVDAQYFSAMLLPQGDGPSNIERAEPIRVGQVDPIRKNLTNTSVRLVSKSRELGPKDSKTDRFVDRFTLFAGPKRPELLTQYRLQEGVYYGMFGWVAKPMSSLLHTFHYVIGYYGLAIIMLTVLVRLCMFPFSRKQALNAQKMQELQPEIKKIQEKYKKDMEGRTKAQQELFKKHNYSPFSGCLVLFIQLPIFMGLYRSLMIDVELRDAPLISEAVRWCSNLAGPDMLYNWSWFMPAWVNGGMGMFGLGPYLNLLPFLTILLFIWQQKMFMPPAADEQSAMQQKVMQYMMILMGFMFYKVSSGLCIYFVASSLWGIAERKFLPKKHPDGESLDPAVQGGGPASPGRGLRLPSIFGNGEDAAAKDREARRKARKKRPRKS